MEIEEWKTIKGYEGYYEVSNLGQIKSIGRQGGLTGKIRKPVLDKKGYLYVMLSKPNTKVKLCAIARLVGIAFVSNVNNYQVIDHINRVKTDNRAVNLRWVTKQENNFNLSKSVNNTSGHTGVCWVKDKKKWRATIMVKGKTIYGGYFDNKEDAIKRRDELKEQYHSIG